MRVARPLLALILMAAACSPYRKPSPDTNYGTYPDNYEELIESYMNDRSGFKDPGGRHVWRPAGAHASGLWFTVLGMPRQATRYEGFIPFGWARDFTGYAVEMRIGTGSEVLTRYALIRDGVVIELDSNTPEHLNFIDQP